MTTKRDLLIFSESDAVNAVKAIGALDLKKKWRITIQLYRKNRTTDQNSLMWSWYSEIAGYTGHSTDEIHELCKAMFLKPRQVSIGDNATEYRTTTKLTTAEMSEYLERIRAWAATDLNLTLSAWGEAA